MSGQLQVVLATHNRHKVTELARILTQAGSHIELLSADDFAALPDVAETGATFAANAVLKATAVAEYTHLPAIADDSGLCVDALSGMPGIFSARWCGRHGDDQANLDLLLAQLADVPDQRRGAHFFCAAAIAVPTPHGVITRVVEGAVEGRLTRAPRGTNGFGYDPIFIPAGHDVTTAEMDSAAKDAISHRGQAMRAAVPVLMGLLGDTAEPGGH